MILVGPGKQQEGDPLNNDVIAFEEPPPGLPPGSMFVYINREMFSDFFRMRLDNGYTEEIHYEEVRDWFKARGADMDALEKALDEAWNFQKSEFVITNPKTPIDNRGKHTPRL